MKPMQFAPIVGGHPVWMGDDFANVNLLPNGARLKSNSVPVQFNARPVQAGQLVGRPAGSSQWYFIPPASTALTTTLDTTLVSAAAAGATVLTLAEVDGYRSGQAITVGSSAATVAVVDKLSNTVTLTAGLAAAQPAGSVVRQSTAQPLTELFLMATDMVNANSDNEFTLYRHNRLVYQNMLPGWAEASAAYRSAVTSRYQCIDVLP